MIYLDASALLKFVHQERESDKLEHGSSSMKGSRISPAQRPSIRT